MFETEIFASLKYTYLGHWILWKLTFRFTVTTSEITASPFYTFHVQPIFSNHLRLKIHVTMRIFPIRPLEKMLFVSHNKRFQFYRKDEHGILVFDATKSSMIVSTQKNAISQNVQTLLSILLNEKSFLNIISFIFFSSGWVFIF